MPRYYIDDDQVETECEPNIGKKLKLFQNWLYGSDSRIICRLAPSLIVRSEAELFGISSPRFAVRAYLSNDSFVNIRRKSLFRGMIQNSVEDTVVKDRLTKSLDSSNHMWMADSLLAPPRRLTEGKKKYEFLTVQLGREYGESADCYVTPFVTHLSVGGGLCAQAACYMALCLAESDPIYGISEITKLANDDESVNTRDPENPFKIHGLTVQSIARFFASDIVENSNAQLQTIFRQDVEQKSQRSTQFLSAALKSYVRNGIPIIALVSSSRMQGANLTGQKPIFQLNGFELNLNDYSHLPIGIEPPTDQKRDQMFGKSGVDNHSVVIVGVNDEGVCLNDPATFPFLEASFEQLLSVRAYQRDDAPPEADLRIELVEGNASERPQQQTPFQFIAITPSNVAVPLLDFHEKVFEVRPEYQSINDFDFQGVLATAADVQNTEVLKFTKHPQPILGEFFLAEIATELGEYCLCSPRTGLPKIDANLVSHLNKEHRYWIQMLDYPNKAGNRVPQLWFWNASRIENRDVPDLVLLKSGPDGRDWVKRDY